MTMRALVTGGSGFVGNCLARHLLAEGHSVHLLVRPQYQTWRLENLAGHVDIHKACLLDAETVLNVVRTVRPEWVFHLATYGAYSDQIDETRILNVNVAGTATLLKACLETGFAAFVNTGTSSEYGFRNYAPPETECPDPNSYYAFTKASTTMLAKYLARKWNAHIPTLRLYSVYGPYEEPKRFIPNLVIAGLRHQLPPLVTANTARDFVFVDDVVKAYLLAARSEELNRGAVYNVGTGTQITIREAVAVIKDLLPIPVEPDWNSMPGRSWDTETWVADNRLIRKSLGWTPQYDFASGLRKTVTWFQDNPEILHFYQNRIQGGD